MLNRALLSAVLLSAACFAQSAPPSPQATFYRLDFVVKELSGGKVTNSRSYVMITRAEQRQQSIRTGDKVPVRTSTVGDQFTYVNVGVDIDVQDVDQSGTDLRMRVSADISNAEKDAVLPNPIIRQTRWTSSVMLPLRKPTTLFSSDSAGSKTQLQLELTATPLQ